MTREELLGFIEKNDLLSSLKDEAERERILGLIQKADDARLRELEKGFQKMYDNRAALMKKMKDVKASAKAFIAKAQKLENTEKEQKERAREAAQQDQQLNSL